MEKINAYHKDDKMNECCEFMDTVLSNKLGVIDGGKMLRSRDRRMVQRILDAINEIDGWICEVDVEALQKLKEAQSICKEYL